MKFQTTIAADHVGGRPRRKEQKKLFFISAFSNSASHGFSQQKIRTIEKHREQNFHETKKKFSRGIFKITCEKS